MRTGCQSLAAGDLTTAIWLVIAISSGIVVGFRSGVDVVTKDRMRPKNWAAVAVCLIGSAGGFLYILEDPHRRCGDSSVEIFFALQPTALSAFAAIFTTVGAYRMRSRRRTRRDANS